MAPSFNWSDLFTARSQFANQKVKKVTITSIQKPKLNVGAQNLE